MQSLSVMFIIALMCYELFPLSATIKIALHEMDREMREEYLVVIQAKDMGGHMGGLSGTTTVTVTLTDINDNPPKFSKSKPLYQQWKCNEEDNKSKWFRKRCVIKQEIILLEMN